jgi:hypothetical protein
VDKSRRLNEFARAANGVVVVFGYAVSVEDHQRIGGKGDDVVYSAIVREKSEREVCRLVRKERVPVARAQKRRRMSGVRKRKGLRVIIDDCDDTRYAAAVALPGRHIVRDGKDFGRNMTAMHRPHYRSAHIITDIVPATPSQCHDTSPMVRATVCSAIAKAPHQSPPARAESLGEPQTVTRVSNALLD